MEIYREEDPNIPCHCRYRQFGFSKILFEFKVNFVLCIFNNVARFVTTQLPAAPPPPTVHHVRPANQDLEIHSTEIDGSLHIYF